ncbi:glycosyltransferase family 4 protein [Bacillus weihaiensis]|uniref:Glycosyl transferase family 1 n=1 Tax=Bacillus weihaiensis TaxID=1547283 RepID=A0A1L3MMJ9_9BACI|nr:glycosyltransferase family 4 protein [Bacillus weihaiensis]APH03556.1 hypothetical protein A9C19_01635 [Bacillus weihaiensis]
MRVFMWPKINATNQYNKLLSDSLEAQDIEVHNFPRLNLENVKKLKGGDIFHMHWLHGTYQHQFFPFFLIKVVKMFFFLFLLKAKSVKIVWTLHNLYPHKYKFKMMEKLVRKCVTSVCNHIFVASDAIRERVLQEYSVPKNKITIIPHGHYVGVYQSQGINFRERYGINDEEFVYLFFGQIKPYKGVPNLVKSFQILDEKLKNQKKISVIVAGKPSDGAEVQTEKLQKENNPHVHLDIRFIPDEELHDLIQASNAVVLPFEEITTSGSAILALSLRKIVVAPRTRFLVEYLGDETAVLYNKDEKNGLAKAMEIAIQSERKFTKENFDKKIEQLSWEKISLQLKKIYKDL